MNDKPAIEDQLRMYADAIDPSTHEADSGRSQSARRGPSIRAVWLTAAAAVLVLVAGAAALAQRQPVQQVETVPFAQEPEGPSGDGTSLQSQAPPIVQGDDPIYWPGGSTDPVETVERFLDLSFPSWRDLDLQVAVAGAPLDSEPALSSRAVVEIHRSDGQLFATAPMRFGDGRWFLEMISSPVLILNLTRNSLDGSMDGEAISELAGELQIDLVYPLERSVVSTSSVSIGSDMIGTLIPITIDQQQQEVQARLLSPSNELLAIAAFTAPTSLSTETLGAGTTLEGPLLPDDIPETGDWRTRDESLVVMLAELVLLEECMTDDGFDFTMPTNQELVELHGSWRPHGILGIGTAGAARLIGYQDANWGGAGSPTQSAAWQTMSQEQQNAYHSALSQRCWASAEAALGDATNRRVEFDRLLQFGSDETQGERFRNDPVLAGAIGDWQHCIQEATGIEADTPNTLARQYAFGRSTDLTREREIAVADVTCQQATRLEEAFYVARTIQVRAELGDQATVFDEYVRFRSETVTLAQAILDQRGITPPSLG